MYQRLSALVSASFPQIIKCAHTERFPFISPQCRLGFVYLCEVGFLCGLHVGSLVKEVAFSFCVGGSRDHDLVPFLLLLLFGFHFFTLFFPLSFLWLWPKGALPPGEARPSFAVDQSVIWDETRLGVPCCWAILVHVNLAHWHMK